MRLGECSQSERARCGRRGGGVTHQDEDGERRLHGGEHHEAARLGEHREHPGDREVARPQRAHQVERAVARLRGGGGHLVDDMSAYGAASVLFEPLVDALDVEEVVARQLFGFGGLGERVEADDALIGSGGGGLVVVLVLVRWLLLLLGGMYDKYGWRGRIFARRRRHVIH